jgi:hypothetical protein
LAGRKKAANSASPCEVDDRRAVGDAATLPFRTSGVRTWHTAVAAARPFAGGERSGLPVRGLLSLRTRRRGRPFEVYRDRLILYGCGDLLNDYEGIGG